MAAKRNRQRQRRLRQQRRQTKRLLNPTPRQLRREARQMARLEYKPVIKAARDDIRISKTNQRQLNQFYTNYRGAVGTSADKSDANTQRLYQQSRDTAADLGKRYDDKINTLAAEDAKSAELRGAANDSSNQQRSLAGESQRQNLMAADSKLLSQLGSASSAYLRNVALASNQGQRLDNRRERNRQQEARNKIRDAKKERNAKIGALRSEQREAERNWRITKRSAANKAGYNAALRDQSAKGLQGRLATADAMRAQAAGRGGGGGRGGRSGGGGGGGGGRGGVPRQEVIKGIADINQNVRESEKSRKARRWWYNHPRALREWLISEKGYSPRAARKITRRWRNSGPRPGSKAWAKKNKERSGR